MIGGWINRVKLQTRQCLFGWETEVSEGPIDHNIGWQYLEEL
jgi:hypothetical protein